MRSVVSGVIVRKMDQEDPAIVYRCQLTEKYPGDFRWRCGACLIGWVKPYEGVGCDTCPAVVTEIIRDEDNAIRQRREQMAMAQPKLDELLQKLERFQQRSKSYLAQWEEIRQRKIAEADEATKANWQWLTEMGEQDETRLAFFTAPQGANLTPEEDNIRARALNERFASRYEVGVDPAIPGTDRSVSFRSAPAPESQAEKKPTGILMPPGKRRIKLAD
jgi:hypothetical protein